MLNSSKFKVSIIAVLSAIILSTFVLPALALTARANSGKEPAWTYADCERVVDLVENNVEKFAIEYNKTVEEDNYLNATSVEYSTIITEYLSDRYLAYIDFDGENGYAVISGIYDVYDLHVNGDYEILRNTQNLKFSKLDGFLALDGNGEWRKVIEDTSEQDYEAPKKSYNGQYFDADGGDGKIFDIDSYVKDRYPEYTFSREYGVNYTSYKTQDKTCYYCKVIYKLDEKTGNYVVKNLATEENCALTAMYNLFRIWSDEGIIKNIPTGKADISNSMQSDPLYFDYHYKYNEWGENNMVDKIDEASYYIWKVNDNTEILQNMPVLYSEIRDRAIYIGNYTPDSGFATEPALGVMKYVANELHGNNIKPVTASNLSDGHTRLNTGSACYFTIKGSSAYGSHAVALLGYKVYTYTTGWWIFSSTHEAYFYKISDGWYTKLMYYDPNTGNNPKLEISYLR